MSVVYDSHDTQRREASQEHGAARPSSSAERLESTLIRDVQTNWGLNPVQQSILIAPLPEMTKKSAMHKAVLQAKPLSTIGTDGGHRVREMTNTVMDSARRIRRARLPRTRVMNALRESWLVPTVLKPTLIRAVLATRRPARTASSPTGRRNAERSLERRHATALLHNLKLNKLRYYLSNVAKMVYANAPLGTDDAIVGALNMKDVRGQLREAIAAKQNQYNKAGRIYRWTHQRPNRLLRIIDDLSNEQLLAGMYTRR